MFTLATALLVASASVSVNALPQASTLHVIPSSTVYNLSAEHKHIFHPSWAPGSKRSENEERSCGSYNTAAQGTASAMQSLYYNSGGWYQGGSGGGSAWTDVNAVEDLVNLMLFNSETTFDGVPEAVLSHYQNQLVTSGSNDDALWGVLANFKECDYLSWRGESTSTCMSRAIALYNTLISQWDSVCGGGVWWSTAKTYKNAITNELFLVTSAAGYLRTGQSAFLSNAQIEWSFLQGSGMQNSQGLYNDGLTSSCTNNGQTTWTYNQIVVASGLAYLYAATGSSNGALLTAAQTSIDATFADMETNSILRESCDNAASGGSVCDADQQIFKGIFMKHLQYFLDAANSGSLNSKYTGQINSQGSAVVHYGTGPGYTVGSVWYAPNSGGSILSPKTQTSGLAALNSAAKYVNC